MRQVYLLLECSGEYEDYIEMPIKVYTSLEKAEAAKKEYEARNEAALEQAKLCMRCPLSLNIYDNEAKFLADKEKCPCNYAKSVVFDDEEGVICSNETWYTNCFYKIIPVEEED